MSSGINTGGEDMTQQPKLQQLKKSRVPASPVHRGALHPNQALQETVFRTGLALQIRLDGFDWAVAGYGL